MMNGRWIGKMGGWLARGKQDTPGTTCIWRGLVRRPTLVQGYLLALHVSWHQGQSMTHSLKCGVQPGQSRGMS